MSDLRFYTFVNFYLSPIQQGVQSFHVCHEMFMKYREEKLWEEWVKATAQLYDWAENHKTVIVLNGGANEEIAAKYSMLFDLRQTLKIPLPVASFNEDAKSLGGIMTACGCVLPEEIYDAVDYKRSGLSRSSVDDQNSFYFFKDGKLKHQYDPYMAEHELITMLKSCALAR